MNKDIVITVNLLGRIKGSVSHTGTQAIRRSDRKTVEIFHTDRGDQECYKRIPVASEVVDFWVSGSAPSFLPARDWRRMTRKQKLDAHVSRFDEGYGVAYEEI